MPEGEDKGMEGDIFREWNQQSTEEQLNMASD